ncbi:PIG-L family deacetylase, partial [Caulobacter sp. 17J65-9]|uniref:PIG-L family deacetylase n=1 Tax=Caulobacter sp. 17J65-9 TaxID=2709382 RepID=UPI0013CC1DCD
ARAGFDGPAAYAEARRRELDAALEAAWASPRRRAYDVSDQTAAMHLPDLARRLADDLADREAVFTHPYEGGHPDHDAAAFAVAAAVRLLARAGQPAPARYEFASYHRAPQGRVAGVFHASPGHPETLAALSPDDRRRKTRALAAFRTQGDVGAWFPEGVERWRPAPDYDFTRAPPPGGCLYDEFGWAMTGEVWRDHARAALAELELAP